MVILDIFLLLKQTQNKTPLPKRDGKCCPEHHYLDTLDHWPQITRLLSYIEKTQTKTKPRNKQTNRTTSSQAWWASRWQLPKGAPAYCGNLLSFHTYSLHIFANSFAPLPCSVVKHWAWRCAEEQKDHSPPRPVQNHETIWSHMLTFLKQAEEASEKFSEDNLDLNRSPFMRFDAPYLIFLNFWIFNLYNMYNTPTISFSMWYFAFGCVFVLFYFVVFLPQ